MHVQYRAFSALLVVLFAASCAGSGRGAVYPDVSGSYSGGISVEGQAIDGMLQIIQDGPVLTVSFDSPSFGVHAEGEGQVTEEGEARIFLSYDLQCPGTAEMAGTFSPDASLFRGSILAADCTGELGGSFHFSR